MNCKLMRVAVLMCFVGNGYGHGVSYVWPVLLCSAGCCVPADSFDEFDRFRSLRVAVIQNRLCIRNHPGPGYSEG